MKEKHEHEFEDLKLARITRVHQDYKGSAGDMAFITKQCRCGRMKPVDYGRTSDMRKKFKQLQEGVENARMRVVPS